MTSSSQYYAAPINNYDQPSLVQQLARLRMELDMTVSRLETAEQDKLHLTAERDLALQQLSQVEKSSNSEYLRSLHPLSSLRELSVPLLQNIESQLKDDLQRIRTIILDKAAGKCLHCLDKSATIRLPICHHKVLCEVCYMKTNECPSCQASVTIQ